MSGKIIQWITDLSLGNDAAKVETHRTNAQTQIAIDLAGITGISVNDVIVMRESGMTWNSITRELGIHPDELSRNGKKIMVGNGK